ncbi:MAG TPA: hypothetical protein PLG17_10495 [Thermodesulfobacteriota bacterium]|nr:hypothetical protein [Thermodesulfobacteriota bacterium]HQO78925.1 hypothetical protein [Thermodesulfobacteriota bacterium]
MRKVDQGEPEDYFISDESKIYHLGLSELELADFRKLLQQEYGLTASEAEEENICRILETTHRRKHGAHRSEVRACSDTVVTSCRLTTDR